MKANSLLCAGKLVFIPNEKFFIHWLLSVDIGIYSLWRTEGADLGMGCQLTFAARRSYLSLKSDSCQFVIYINKMISG